MTDRIGWGILATGGIAHAFAGDLLTAGLDLRAVGSRSQESADRFAAQYGGPRAHGSYEDLVADPDVDIVYIATPHSSHAEYAELALRAGKHVLVEKAFTLTAAEARRVVDLAAERGLLVLEAMWTRFLPHMVRIREIIESGAIGEVTALVADHTQKLPQDPSHRLNALELGGGALLDLGVYPISFASDLFGTPTAIAAVGGLKETGADARVSVSLGYADGRVASIFTASDSRGTNTAEVLGTSGRISIDSVWYTPTSFRVLDADDRVVESYESAVEGRGMQYQALEAERLIAEGSIASPLLSPEESVSIMATMDEIRRQIGVVYPGE